MGFVFVFDILARWRYTDKWEKLVVGFYICLTLFSIFVFYFHL